MKKTILTFISLFLVVGIASAEMMVLIEDQKSSSRISIPSGAAEYASEKDIVEAMCYEAKWKGGEGIARIEALDEMISPVLDDLSNLGISIDNPQLSSKSSEMRQKIEAICSAENNNEASQRISEYIELGEGIRNYLQGDFTVKLRGSEKELISKGEQLREKLEKEIGEEGKRIAKEVEARLRSEGEAEGKAIENQMKQLASEFESFMSSGEVGPAEAQAKARSLASRISADSSTTSFLSSKFEAILGEAISLIPRIMAGDIDPTEIQAIVIQKVPGHVNEIKEFMETKYRNIGKQEEEKIRKELEKKADEIGGKEKIALENIRDAFADFENKLEVLSQQKRKEWSPYEAKALEKKREIIVKAVDAHFKDAEKLIESRKDQIQIAIDEGVAEEYGIISYESLMANLKADRNQIIDEFMTSDASSESIAITQRKFQSKWNDYRQKMEAIEMGSAEDAIEKILNGANWKEVRSKMSTAIREIGSAPRAHYEKRFNECRDNPELFNPPEITGNKKIYISNSCIDCRILEEAKIAIDRSEAVDLEDLEAKKDLVTNNIWQLESRKDMSLQDVLRIKNELMEAVDAFRSIEEALTNAENNLKKARERAQEICVIRI